MIPQKKRSRTPKIQVHKYTSVPPKDEHEFQTYCHEWLERCYPALVAYAVPNGAKTPGRKVTDKFGNEKRVSLEALKLKREGLLTGVADYFIAKPIQTKNTESGWYHGLYIEFKFGSNKQSDSQIDFQKKVGEEDYLYLLIYDNRNVVDANGCLDPLLHFKRAVLGLSLIHI